MLKLYFLILLSSATSHDKLKTMYLLAQVQEPRITCAIIRYETGHLRCANEKRICSLDYNNLFGFRYKNKYLRFSEYGESVAYYIRWQERKWRPYHRRHPDKTYYDFLKWVGYCNSMKDYIRTIKQIEKQ